MFILMAGVCLGPLGPASADALSAGEARLDADRQRDLDHLLEDLRDPKLELPRRRRAATILLDRGWDEADRAVRRLLIHSEDTHTRRAIAQGVADAGSPSPAFIEPLIELIGADDSALRQDAAAALGRFDRPDLVALMAEVAVDAGQPLSRRLGALRALGHQRTRTAAGALIELVGREDEPEALRSAAFEALGQLTGISHMAQETDVWQRWWERVRELEGAAWMRELMWHINARNAALARRAETLATRLTDAQQQIYDATPEDGRPAIVQRMLADELPELRLKALQLIEQRLLNGQKVSEGTVAATRERLMDLHRRVRTQAALVLESLADAKAAELAMELLSVEPEPSVQAAYLRLLTRVPQRDAVGPAMRLLEIPELRGPAATFLIAAYDQQWMSESQIAQVLAAARQSLTEGSGAELPMLGLLGRAGEEQDLQLAVAHLTHSQNRVRTAAVEAFENERWPLTPLLDHLSDASLRIAAWSVISKRGRSATLLQSLLDHEPEEADRRSEWARAVAAVSRRMSVDDLLKVDASLRTQSDRRETHEAVLMAAAGLNGEGNPAPASENGSSTSSAQARAEAELLLAEHYLRHRETGKARPILSRLASREGLGAEHRQRVGLGRLQRMLQQRAWEEAVSHTRGLLESPEKQPAVEAIATLWLGCAEEVLPNGEASEMQDLVNRIIELFEDRLDEQGRMRLTALQERLREKLLPSAADTTAPLAP